MALYFYKVNDEYGCFSNFSHHSFEIEGKRWKTSEHYFQAMKFAGTDLEDDIRMLSSPMDAAICGRDRANPLRTDWEDVKDDIMMEAVYQKFSQNKDICKVLLSTGEETIIEKTSNDYYWGCGKNGTGKNMLGKILMEVRARLKSED